MSAPATRPFAESIIGWAVPAVAVGCLAAASAVDVPPFAGDDEYSVSPNTVLPVAPPGLLANDTDSDGGALTARVVADVSHGLLTLGPDGSFTYLPEAGFTGIDAFTYVASDGTWDSTAAGVTLHVGQPPLLFTATFVDTHSVEIESTRSTLPASGVALHPIARHGFADVTSGSLTWEFELDWTRMRTETNSAFYMQLGDGAQMSAEAPHAGVGVNLVWMRIDGQDRILGYRRAGTTTGLRRVNGFGSIRVQVDVDALVYDVHVDGAPVRSAIPFDVPVALNTVRFLTNGLNEVPSRLPVKSVKISGQSSGSGGNTAPVASSASVRAADGVAKTITLAYTDGDGPGPYTIDVVDHPRHGTLGDDDGDAAVVYTANAGFVGNDSFTFRVKDGVTISNLATVSLVSQHYPGAAWETRTPAQLGMDAAKLDQLAASIGGVGTVVKNGYVVKTWGDQTSKADWASASKPVLNMLLFFAVQEGRIDRVEDPVKPWVLAGTGGALRPEDESMTFAHLTNMTSGYARIERPGVAYAYNDIAVQLKNRLIGAIFGEPLDSRLRARLAPLQLQDGSLLTTRGGYGLSTTTRDFARIAWLWLNRGNWRGQQVLGEHFFDDYLRTQVPASMPRTAGADVDYLNVGTAGGGTDQTPYGPGQFGMNWWFNSPDDTVGTTGLRPWPDAPSDSVQAHGHWNREFLVWSPSLNVVVTSRGNWGSLVPGNTSSGVSQRLKLLTQAAGPLVLTSMAASSDGAFATSE